MFFKELGRTGVKLPEIGMGTWLYEGGVEPLHRGIAHGATLIDTAELYGTEPIVGEAIRACRNRIFLASKVSPRHFRHQDVVLAAERSLKRLKTDYIDLYQLHWPYAAVPIDETLGAMEQLCDQGKIKYIGVSNFTVSELKQAQAVMSKYPIVSNQVCYSLVNRTVESDLLQYCADRRITVLAYSPLAQGMDRLRRNDQRGILPLVAREAARTEAQVALNWCLARDHVIAIPKSNSAARVIENCDASDWRLSAEQFGKLSRGIQCQKRGKLQVALRRFVRRSRQRLGARPPGL